jgi:hypothetical protein
MSRYIGNVSLTQSAIKNGSQLTFYKTGNAFGVSIGAPSGLSANYTFTLPTTAGAANQTLQTDGSGVTTWVDTILQGGNAFGATALFGTTDANDVNIEANGTVRVTIPHSTAGGMTINGTGDVRYVPTLTLNTGNNALGVGITISPFTAAYNLTLPPSTGTANQALITDGSGISSWANAFLQGGNTYGASAVIGTLDAFSLNLATNGVNRFCITTLGDAVVRGDGTVARNMKFEQKDNTAAVSIKAPDTGITNYTLVLPAMQATASGQTLVNDGTGTLYWGVTEPSDVVQYSDLAVSASATLGLGHNLIEVDATAGNVVLTLPAIAVSKGMNYMIFKVDASANTVQIVPASGEKYDNVVNNANIILSSQYDRIDMLGVSTGWFTN